MQSRRFFRGCGCGHIVRDERYFGPVVVEGVVILLKKLLAMATTVCLLVQPFPTGSKSKIGYLQMSVRRDKEIVGLTSVEYGCEQDLDITMNEAKLMASIYSVDHLCEIKSRFFFFQWGLVKQKHQKIATVHIL